ncbi:hypothetical protein SUS17_3870 [Sphingomonas sp. S17]|jgi:ATP-dependent exoDNAse (exonuclease V) alpha subunit|nr:hypothetical protein SUS17_3870 [Sphingomonas sp. S17]
MAVRLDDGRGVAFDTKDYAHVDHGYAATIHKSQGVTVDRAPVLATPGMDRHSAYVGMSRHRDDVHLHYGRATSPTSASSSAPCRATGARDMAGDHARPEQDQARAFDRLRAAIEGQDRELALLRRAVEGLAAERAARSTCPTTARRLACFSRAWTRRPAASTMLSIFFPKPRSWR